MSNPPPGGVRRAGPLARRQLSTFFGLVVLFALPFWLLGWLAGPEARLLGELPLASLQFIVPLGAALVAAVITSGRDGVRHLLTRAGAPRGSGRLTALIAAVSIMPAVHVVAWASDPSSGRPLVPADASLAGIGGAALLFLVTAWAEEVGWTGYALTPSVRRWGPAGAALIIGAAWAVIHIIPDLQAGHDLVWIASQRIGTLAQRVIIVWIALGSGGSVLVAAIAHAMDNVSWAILTDGGATYDPSRLAPFTLLIAVAILPLLLPRDRRFAISRTRVRPRRSAAGDA